MSRITINGTMSQFSCKLTVRSSLWNAKANKASGKSLESQCVNEKLENIKTNIGKQYQRLCDRMLRPKRYAISGKTFSRRRNDLRPL